MFGFNDRAGAGDRIRRFGLLDAIKPNTLGLVDQLKTLLRWLSMQEDEKRFSVRLTLLDCVCEDP
jgi:hypothetical protein